MQSDHFWYRGRYKFIFYSATKILKKQKANSKILEIGGGTGSWLQYILQNEKNESQKKYYLSDPLLQKNIIRKLKNTDRIQTIKVNLNQRLRKKWNVIFLLDVIEHIENDIKACRNIANALLPDGYLILTAPALKFFWSKNDQFGGHFRRYSKEDLRALAKKSGMKLVECRYFMFFLSPFFWMARRQLSFASSKKKVQDLIYTQNFKLPKTINKILKIVFCLETPIGHFIQFPWGTSIYGVFRKL